MPAEDCLPVCCFLYERKVKRRGTIHIIFYGKKGSRILTVRDPLYLCDVE